MTLRTIHADWAWLVVVTNGLAGIWALLAHWTAPFRRRELWWLVIVAEVAIFVQVGMGVWLQAVDGIEPPAFHTFYGFATIVFVAIFFAYRTQLLAQLYLLYGLGSLFLMGMGLRSIYLG